LKFARLDEFAKLHAQLTMPVLFIWGANDPTFPEPKARDMVAQFPNVVGFHSIPKAKLFLHEEYPGEVARLIEGFLAAAPRGVGETPDSVADALQEGPGPPRSRSA
jgi:pimeloyl-ACP methyl ester carboxylesterase